MRITKDKTKYSSLTWKRFTYDEYLQWISNINNIYNKMRADSIKDNNETICHLSLKVLPNVYSPSYFTDSFWFSKHLPKFIKKGASVLEIGTGTGIISIMLAKAQIKKILATDLFKGAVENACINVKKYKLDNIITVREGDIYEPVLESEKYDYIFWAHPFNNSPYPVLDPLLQTGMDYNYNSLRKYISGARDHLTPNGKLLLGTGDSADLETIWEMANDNNYRMNLLFKEEMPLEYGKKLPIEYRIYEFVDVSNSL